MAPRFIVLCGLPGSGKSTFATHLEKSDSSWIKICQDELGSRAKCEEVLAKNFLGKNTTKRIVIDRCNIEPLERRGWLELAMWPENAVAIFFDVPADVCKSRVKNRENHPKIPYGHGAGIVDSFVKKLTPPTLKEGFSKIYTVQSIEEAQQLLHKFGG